MTIRDFFLAGILATTTCLFIPHQAHAGGTAVAVEENPEPKIRVKIGRKVSIMPIETYLAGVIGHEMSPHWPLEALKAQTVAARSYALSRMENARDGDKNYDVVPTQADQVFHANKSKNHDMLDIVNQTRGEVLSLHGRIVQAYFSSTCGGRMETAAGAGLAEKGQLVKCGKDNFCAISPFRSWQVTSSLTDLEERMHKKGREVNGLKSVKIKKFNKSGYVNSVTYVDADGRHEMSGHDFRYLLGSMNVKSQLFTLKTQRDGTVLISGHGFGHGVGLCQYGAKQMALKGYKYKTILAKYYPGVGLKTIY
jgi:stage II sporulation protein D